MDVGDILSIVKDRDVNLIGFQRPYGEGLIGVYIYSHNGVYQLNRGSECINPRLDAGRLQSKRGVRFLYRLYGDAA